MTCEVGARPLLCSAVPDLDGILLHEFAHLLGTGGGCPNMLPRHWDPTRPMVEKNIQKCWGPDSKFGFHISINMRRKKMRETGLFKNITGYFLICLAVGNEEQYVIIIFLGR